MSADDADIPVDCWHRQIADDGFVVIPHVFDDNDVEYLRAYPSAVLGEEPDTLFARASDNWRAEGWLAQLGWIRCLGHEGGLFFTVGRRR